MVTPRALTMIGSVFTLYIFFGFVAGCGAGGQNSNSTIATQAQYTLSYHGNNSICGIEPDPELSLAPNTQVTLKANEGALKRPDMLFVGWNTSPDGNGQDYAVNEIVTIGNSDVLLYAKWQEVLEAPALARVFILAGQSNMQGASGPLIADAPIGWQRLPSVLFDETVPSGPAPSEDWEIIGEAVSYMGPEVAFAAVLKDIYPNDKIVIVKVSQAGTGISCWIDAGQLCRDSLVARIDVIRSRLDNLVETGVIDNWSFDGFIFMQGENDANSVLEIANAYSERLQSLAAFIRNYTGEEELPIILGRISGKLDPIVGGAAQQPQLDIIRSAQVSWAESDAHSTWVDTDDLNLIDNWHFGSFGQLKLGRKFVDAWLRLSQEHPVGFLSLNQGQSQHSSDQFISYIMEFSRPIVDFDVNKISITGETGANRVDILPVTASNDLSFELQVSGMTSNGLVNLEFLTGAAKNCDFGSLVVVPKDETRVLWSEDLGVEDLIAYDPFSSVAGPLDKVQSGIGWTGRGWIVQNSTDSYYQIINTDPLDYESLLTTLHYASGGSGYNRTARFFDLEYTFRPYMTALNANAIDLAGTTLWMSYLIRPLDVGRPQLVSLTNEPLGSTSPALGSPVISIDVSGAKWRLNVLAQYESTNIDVISGETYLMVLRIVIGGTEGVSSVHLWVNPTLNGISPQLDSAHATVSKTDSNFKFNRIHWYPGPSESTAFLADGQLDEIRIGRTFISVTPVASP